MKELTKILVVDDDEEIGMMIKIILDYKGYSVLIAQRADKIFQTLSTEPIKLIILDMLIGGIKGTDVCEQLKKNSATCSIPVIMLTALPDAELVCKEAGADDFLSKPFEIDNLIAKIEQLIQVEF